MAAFDIFLPLAFCSLIIKCLNVNFFFIYLFCFGFFCLFLVLIICRLVFSLVPEDCENIVPALYPSTYRFRIRYMTDFCALSSLCFNLVCIFSVSLCNIFMC